MNRVLERIVERTRADLHQSPIDLESVGRAARERTSGRQAHPFRRSLSAPGARIIAEIKSASPSAGVILENPPVAKIAASYADGGAAAISVVTEPHFFRGDRGWLATASEASGLPVLMKDFVVERSQVLRGIAAGADAILLLAGVLTATEIRELLDLCGEHGRDGLVEVHDERELERAIEADAPIIGVNNRDLLSFEVSLETSERLAPSIPAGVIRVAESGIATTGDVERLRRCGFSAFLVGESLMRAPDRAGAVRELQRIGVELR